MVRGIFHIFFYRFLNSISKIELVKSSSLQLLPAVFKTSYELVMFIQNSTCTIKIGLACPILIVLVLFPLKLSICSDIE